MARVMDIIEIERPAFDIRFVPIADIIALVLTVVLVVLYVLDAATPNVKGFGAFQETQVILCVLAWVSVGGFIILRSTQGQVLDARGLRFYPLIFFLNRLLTGFAALHGIFYYSAIFHASDFASIAYDYNAAFHIAHITTLLLLATTVIPRTWQLTTFEKDDLGRTFFDRTGRNLAHFVRHLTLGRVILYTLLTFFAFVAMVPFLWMISNSLMTLGETQVRQYTPDVPQWWNYYAVWTGEVPELNNVNFLGYFRNSLIITVITIAGLLSVSILSAYAFARIKFFGRNFVFTLLLATLMIPESVTMIPNFLVVSGNVFPMPELLVDGKILDVQLHNSWINTLPALTVPFMGSAFSIFLLRQFFAQIPNELWEAARIDGSGHFRFLLQIVLPISRPVIMTVTLLAFIAAWNSFLWPLIVTNDATWRPLMVGLSRFSDEAGTRTHWLMAGSLIAIMPMVLLYFSTQKTFTEGIATTGLKG